MTDRDWMEKALRLARLAADEGEIPVGAIVVKDGQIIGQGRNRRETTKNATEHAEILAIAEACGVIGDWRLTDCTLYVTLEPCPMCAGAVVNARIGRVVYGASDSAAGCCGSVLNLNRYPFLHAFSITGGVCEEACQELMRSFFAARRGHQEQKENE